MRSVVLLSNLQVKYGNVAADPKEHLPVALRDQGMHISVLSTTVASPSNNPSDDPLNVIAPTPVTRLGRSLSRVNNVLVMLFLLQLQSNPA
jgi:hypothetical protein